MSIYPCLTELQTWLDSYLNFEKTPKKNIFWLDTMQYLCKSLSHPEQTSPCFHVAGSKGKGSVSAFISSILDAAGYKTGLYSSPHILDFVERIGSAHKPFSEEVYQIAYTELRSKTNELSTKNLPGERPLTWFELVTLYAFLCFKHAAVDYSVYEVGLGGRLDSTNVISPIACCITPIELEHTEFLGNTLQAIAAEKGGIIKKQVPVFIANQKKEVATVLTEIAQKNDAPATIIDDKSIHITTQYQFNSAQNHTYSEQIAPFGMTTRIESTQFSRPLHTTLQMLGAFQAQNAALAAIAVKTLIPSIREEEIERGLSATTLPGRFEMLFPAQRKGMGYSSISALVLDGAHTVNSVHFTLETFSILCKSIKNDGQPHAHLLFACAADKDMKDIATLFAQAEPRFSHITLTRPGSVKQSDIGSLCNAFAQAQLVYDCDEDYEHAITKALRKAEAEKAVLLVTGSFYLLAEVKKLLAREDS